MVFGLYPGHPSNIVAPTPPKLKVLVIYKNLKNYEPSFGNKLRRKGTADHSVPVPYFFDFLNISF